MEFLIRFEIFRTIGVSSFHFSNKGAQYPTSFFFMPKIIVKLLYRINFITSTSLKAVIKMTNHRNSLEGDLSYYSRQIIYCLFVGYLSSKEARLTSG